MSDFYRDLFTGSGSLSGRVPNVGSTPTAPTVDLGDGSYMQAVGDNLLTALQLDGSGAMVVNNTIATSGIVITKVNPAPSTPDYFVEVVVRKPTVTGGYGYVHVYARTSPEVANAPDGVNFIGGYFGVGEADSYVNAKSYYGLEGTSGVYGDNTEGFTDSIYAGAQSIALRVEFDGNQLHFIVDGVVIESKVIVDAGLLVAGDIYVMLEGGSFTANLSDLAFLSMRAGTLPEDGFWTSFIKTTERTV